MTESELRELEQLRAAATPGEWVWNGYGAIWNTRGHPVPGSAIIVVTDTPHGAYEPDPGTQKINLKLIEAAVNTLPKLLAEIRSLQDLLAVMAQDGGDAYDLGKQVGRGECLAAFDGALDELELGAFAGPDVFRDRLLAAGEAVTLPLDELRRENTRLRRALKEIHEALSPCNFIQGSKADQIACEALMGQQKVGES